MRPIRLMMQAFGPYRDVVDIDFTKVNGNGLFLITGDTGGGKTTILDAMCVALYGEPTGRGCKFENLRNKSADDSKNTIVEFEFALSDKVYKFRRTIRIYKKRKEDGMGKVIEQECLERSADGKWETLKQNAQELLGLSREQFTKVMILPQGKFEELLVANSRDKQEILSTLFSLDKWNVYSGLLKDRVKNAKQDYDNANLVINSILMENDVETYNELLERLEQLNDDLKSKKNRQTKCIKARDILNATITSINLINEKTKNIVGFIDEKVCKEQTLSNMKSSLIEAEQKQKLTPNIEKEIHNLTERINYIDELLKNYIGIKKLDDENSELSKKISQLNQSLVNAEKTKQINKERAEKGQSYIERLRVKIAKKPELINRKNDLEKAKCLKILAGDKQILSNRVAHAESVYINYKDVETIEDDISILEGKMANNMAAVLSKRLKDNEPCPVCGSIYHHSVHNEVGNEFSKLEEQIKTKKQVLKAKRLEQSKLKQNLDTLKGQLNAKQEEYSKQRELCANIQNEYFEDCDAKIALANSEINNISREEQRLSEYEVKLNQFKKNSETSQKQIDEISRAINQIENTIKINDALINEKRRGIRNIKSEQELQEEKLDLSKLKKQKEDEIAQINKRLVSLNSDIANLNACITDLTHKIDLQNEEREHILDKISEEIRCENHNAIIQNRHINTIVYIQKRDDLEADINILSQEIGKIDKTISGLCSNIDTIKKQDIDRKEQTYSNIYDIYRRVNGEVKSKVTISNFVIGIIFDEVLHYANQYLRKMSSKRYEMRRTVDNLYGNGKRGLDIEIMDNLYGNSRPVKTLSGGERFLASLSLALGLSESVQRNSGGIRLDSIFIDEGFGSLDGETLNTAMESLSEVQSEGRIIGIISHVEELKRRIPSKIQVHKLGDGNTTISLSTSI